MLANEKSSHVYCYQCPQIPRSSGKIIRGANVSLVSELSSTLRPSKFGKISIPAFRAHPSTAYQSHTRQPHKARKRRSSASNACDCACLSLASTSTWKHGQNNLFIVDQISSMKSPPRTWHVHINNRCTAWFHGQMPSCQRSTRRCSARLRLGQLFPQLCQSFCCVQRSLRQVILCSSQALFCVLEESESAKCDLPI